MSKTLIIPNSLHHVILHGYFEHAFEIWYAMQEKDLDNFNYSDLALQVSLFRNVRARLRGKTYLSPNVLNGIGASLLGAKKNYPKQINFTNDEYYWFNYIIKLPMKQMRKYYKRYFKLMNKPVPEKSFVELITSLRTDEAVDFLMIKFRQSLKIAHEKSQL